MATHVRIDLNHAGMAALLHDGGVQRMLHEKAEAVAEAARSIAKQDAYVSGAYHDSIDVVDVTTDRVTSRVVTGVAYSHLVEVNDGVLSRALDAAS